jgi:PAS domain S-box-containing protein
MEHISIHPPALPSHTPPPPDAAETAPSDLEDYRRLRRAISETGQLIYDCDLVSGSIHWEGSSEAIGGYSLDELHRISLLEWKDYIHPEDRRQALSQFRGVITSGGLFRIRHRLRRKSGAYIMVENRGVCATDPLGVVHEIFGTVSDITDRCRIEAQVRQAQRLESIGVMASGIAHDLNNVLTPIMMACELLALEDESCDRKRLLEMIRLSTQRGADLVRQVLSFCRGIGSQHVLLEPRQVIRNLVAILKEVFPKSIRIESRLDSALWRVSGEPTQLHQVLLNLCVNARDAMPSGGRLLITAENVLLPEPGAPAEPGSAKGPHVRLSVTDTGAGIPLEIQERIFEPFFTTKEPGKGTGLGLSTSLGFRPGDHPRPYGPHDAGDGRPLHAACPQAP